ncbi:hypothetical protein AB0I35_20285 [Nocardia sp. NPDC050378]|uniref:hypothetical protein n=1 Tax=Nocardia sp. NPDC050378 TaxID=3155400 RepID=UPI0033F7B6B2
MLNATAPCVASSWAIVNVALPAMDAALDLGPTGLAWAINAFLLPYAGLLLLGGRQRRWRSGAAPARRVARSVVLSGLLTDHLAGAG